MDPEFEHTLDVEDLCLQMKRSSLLCSDADREDVLTAVRTTRYMLRASSQSFPDIYSHLSHRAKVYDTYMGLVRHSIELRFLRGAMNELQLRMSMRPTDSTALIELLRLVYFIDREICFCAALE